MTRATAPISKPYSTRVCPVCAAGRHWVTDFVVVIPGHVSPGLATANDPVGMTFV